MKPHDWRSFLTRNQDLAVKASVPSDVWSDSRAFSHVLMHGYSTDRQFSVDELDDEARLAFQDLVVAYVSAFGNPGLSLFGTQTDEWLLRRASTHAAIELPRTPFALDLAGATLVSVTGCGRYSLTFEGPDFALQLHGHFHLGTHGSMEAYIPPCPDWVGRVLETLAGVAVRRIAYRSTGELRVEFADERLLFVPDGPFENWHLSYEGRTLHGGVGRVA